MELPFAVSKTNKGNTKSTWRYNGLKFENHLAFHIIYKRYIYSAVCELCDTKYKSRRDRHMEHCHATGKFRNICCQSCNMKKRDVKIRTDNKSGYKHIYKANKPRYKQGFCWVFKVFINGKNVRPKSSTNLEKLIKFRDKWLIENNYHT